jgi:peptidoglycan/xylan/chitin deacetylase (PgdA/CDA1 family)
MKLKAILKNYRNYIISFWMAVSLILISNQWIGAATPIRIPIFSIHEIVDLNNLLGTSLQDISLYTNTKQDLENFLDYLVRNKYWFLSSQELYDYFLTQSKPVPSEHLYQKKILLSFDDGYKGVHTHLFPVLESLKKKYGVTVKLVLFINPSSLNSSTHMTCDDLREGLSKGFYDIQSHSFNHYALTELSSDKLTFELANAQLAIRQCTQGLDPNQTVALHLAYPYGFSDVRVQTQASKYYLSGYTSENLVLQVDKLTNKYQIPRLNITRETSLTKMIQLAESASQLRKTLDLNIKL